MPEGLPGRLEANVDLNYEAAGDVRSEAPAYPQDHLANMVEEMMKSVNDRPSGRCN